MWVQYYDFEKDGLSSFYLIFLMMFFLEMFMIFVCYNLIKSFSYKNNQRGILYNISQRIFIVLLGLVFTGILYVIIVKITSNYSTLKDNTDKWNSIEGKVTNFIKGKGRKRETFTVKKIKFSYSGRAKSFGYSTLRDDGGVIDANKYVRIHYYEGEILRLWVLEKTKK